MSGAVLLSDQEGPPGTGRKAIAIATAVKWVQKLTSICPVLVLRGLGNVEQPEGQTSGKIKEHDLVISRQRVARISRRSGRHART